MGRKILFITTDQMRHDALGCTGGAIARTPVADGWAASGIRYIRAHNQNVVCMPARATMITGQHVRTHGVTMNGIALPEDAPSVARLLRENGYRTALIGKAHFEPAFDPKLVHPENRLVRDGQAGERRGFERMELVMHGPAGPWHYPAWLQANFPGEAAGFYPVLAWPGPVVNHAGGGDTGACQVAVNPIPREHYHTDWVADRVIAFLDGLDPDDDWFVWMSFPDPHHPWDPPAAERRRVNWRDLDPPEGWPGGREAAERILSGKPRHWLQWYRGELVSNFEAPAKFVPAAMTEDQVREINALVHVENELIDEACGRVMARIAERGWAADTDVMFTTDHGEFQGEFGLLFKGPYHVDALMRVPLLWRPAPSAGVAPAVVERPVGHLDLAPTFCAIAGLPVPDWMEGKPLPLNAAEAEAQGRERVLTEWDSDLFDVELRLRSLYRDGWLCTVCEPGTLHEGSEGELYDLADDPLQRVNLWDDPARRSLRADLVADLRDSLPPARAEPLPRTSMV